MDWGAIGAIGEVVGGVAVLATLAYLAVQTRQLRTAAEAGGTIQAIEYFGRWRETILQNSELAAVLAKGKAGESMSEQERIQFEGIFEALFWVAVVSHAVSSRAGSIHDASSEVSYVADRLEVYPGAVSEWNRRKAALSGTSPDFVTMVDHVLAAGTNAG